MDWALRLGEASPDCTPADDEHCRGEVWSGALWAIRGALGGAVADRLVIQSHFSLTAAASFDQAARALLAADSALYAGAHRTLLKAVLGARGLVDVERLDDTTADASPLGTARAGEREPVRRRRRARRVRAEADRAAPGGAAAAGQQRRDYDLRLLAPGTHEPGRGAGRGGRGPERATRRSTTYPR